MPEVLIISAALVHGFLLVNALLNLIHLRRGRQNLDRQIPELRLPSLSVLVPARNEEKNLPRLLGSIEAQDHPNFEVLVYDDQSEDRTWEIVRSSASKVVRGLRGTELPDGWTGKVHACYRLASEARGDVFLFLDADTELLEAGALSRMAAAYVTQPRGSVVTGMPHFRGGGMLLVSMVGAMILGGLPWWMGRRVPASVLSGLNGQCWMIDADTYRRLDPHRNNRGEILEDILIGRYLHRMGTTPLLVDFQRELAVYMYDDLKEAWRGFRRSAAEALGKSFPGAMAGLLAYLFFFVAVPMVHPGFLIPLYALKATTDRASRIPYRNTLVAPISFLLAGALTADSIVKRTRRRLEWKGRILSTGR